MRTGFFHYFIPADRRRRVIIDRRDTELLGMGQPVFQMQM